MWKRVKIIYGFGGRLIKYQIQMILTHVERGKNKFGFASRLTKYQILIEWSFGSKNERLER